MLVKDEHVSSRFEYNYAQLQETKDSFLLKP